MNLQAELENLSQKIQKDSPVVHNSLEMVVAGLRKSDLLQRGLKVGDQVADFELKNIYHDKQVGDTIEDFSLPNPWGEQISLSSLLANGPVVLNFYRGNWCPFCNMELRAFVKISAQIRQLGANLVAISPERPEESEKTLEIVEMKFIVLSDIDSRLARRFNLAFVAPKYNQFTKENSGLDLTVHNKDSQGALVIPATYVIDRNSVIRFAFADDDFRRRVNMDDILNTLREIQAESKAS